ncbi:MAG TPA: putative LPS assembly protein LptD, partial [Longimicrobiales bacterium]|nr:putative LPS assembly protein LptD [Longimicrobiales bacterium]
MRTWVWGRAAVVAACLTLAPVAAFGQMVQTGPQTAADSARLRILERIQRLGRAPGADSALFLQDSLAQEARENRRGGGRSQGDSIVSALLDMPGFALTEYQGGEADFSAKDRVLVLHAMEGTRARVNREGLEVQADSSITYSEAEGKVRTVGASTFTPPEGEAVESQGLVYDLPKAVGSARGARTSYAQGGGKWLVRGDMPLAAQDSMFMSHAIFTSCDLEVPHYHFETDEIKIIGGKVMVARPVRLYFADVPVAWLPFIAQSTSQGRASGILTPTFSVNDIVRNSNGYRRRISNLGFYWAMSDYSDAIVAMDWFSDNFLSLTSSIDYRFNRQFLNGNLDFRQYWRRDGSKELALDTRHNWEIDERTSVRISGRYATSTDFIRQNSFNPAEVTQSIDSEGGMNRRFGWGSLSLSANRRQYMSDDRIEWTLPT